MAESYISRRDRIVASAIELIGDSGLQALTTKNLARRENISEALIYKYFGGIDDVLVDIVKEYVNWDASIQITVSKMEGTYLEKIRYYADTYATYYDNYIGMAAIMLQYEELLHVVETRDIISTCILNRNDFVCNLYQNALDNKEIRPVFTAKELTLIFNGIMSEVLLERRTKYSKKSIRIEVKEIISRLEKVLKV